MTPGAGGGDDRVAREPCRLAAGQRGDRPVLQEVRAVVEDPAETAFVDELLGKSYRGDAPVVVPDCVRNTRRFDRLHHLLPLGEGSRRAARTILPAAAAAKAISAWVLLGVQMSMASMSVRATSFRQSVSVDS